ncbi:hypothetical protein C8Q79DRAFT_761457 [Trametes meyenii]|nr:hypothetical protein C8Q79DRAFT_761457 [Trametes meyenii]
MRERAAREPAVTLPPRPPVFSLPPQKQLPEPAKPAPAPAPARSRSASTEPAWDEVTRSPLPPWVFPRPMSEVRRALQEITPLADRDERAKAEVRELGMLIDYVEERTASLKMRAREMQKLRLALECYFSQFKDDPRLLNGAWAPFEEQTGSADEEDMVEVEELTSREISPSDLPDVAEKPVARCVRF